MKETVDYAHSVFSLDKWFHTMGHSKSLAPAAKRAPIAVDRVLKSRSLGNCLDRHLCRPVSNVETASGNAWSARRTSIQMAGPTCSRNTLTPLRRPSRDLERPPARVGNLWSFERWCSPRINREAGIRGRFRETLVQAYKRVTSRPFHAPDQCRSELPSVARAQTVVVGQRLRDHANDLGRQDLVPRSMQLAQEFDGVGALHRAQVAITHKAREGAAGFDRRPPPGNNPAQLANKPTPLSGR
jgi:hypothetical protein